MEVKKTKDEQGFNVLALSGRLDTNTASLLEKEVDECFQASEFDVVVDLDQLDYVSSAGLRILLGAHKKCMAGGGTLRIRNLKNDVAEVFDITGFSSVLNVEL